MNKLNLAEFRMPAYNELPQFGLYLEQTVKYINGYITPLGFTELTTSMVSNYVKLGIVAPPVKKQYDAEQLAYLFFVAIAKNVLSMDTIKMLIQMQQSTYPTRIAYDYFCQELKNMLLFTFGLKDTVDEISTSHSAEKTMLRSVIIAVAQLVYFYSRLEDYQQQ